MKTEIGKEVERETGQGTDLWRLITGPVIWAAHFVVCYVFAAVYCEKLGRTAELAPVRWAVILFTIAALVGIAIVIHSLWKVRGLSTVNNDFNYNGNTPEERHRFLSHVSLMLCFLSVAGVVYVAIPALLLETCR